MTLFNIVWFDSDFIVCFIKLYCWWGGEWILFKGSLILVRFRRKLNE